MRSARLCLLLSILLFNIPVRAQQNSQQTAPLPTVLVPKPLDDAQTLDVVGRALNVAGGATVLSAISDYTATGEVTYHWGGKDVQGTVNVSGRGRDQFRMDANLPTGVRSWAASRGAASEKGEDGKISQVRGFSSLSPSSIIFPYMQLVAAVKQQSSFSVLYKGLIEVDGNSAHDIRVQRVIIDGSSQQIVPVGMDTLDFFIDASSFQVLMTRDMARPSRNSADGPPHEIRFSDYRAVNGVLVPFSISESVAGQQTSVIDLNAMTFNSGLTDSNFQF